MTLPGGAAAKLGYRYEKWWTLSQLVRMLRGETDSLRIESPGVDGVEFVVQAGGDREYHQAKRSHPSGQWSVATLASERVLATVGDLLIGNEHRFVFVSGSDARELADLHEAGIGAESLEEFTAQFLGAKKRVAAHRRLLEEWDCDGETALDVLRRIDVHTISERQLEDKVGWGISALFLGSVDRLCDLLAATADDAVHRTIGRDDLLGQLREAGFLLREVRSPQAARQAVVDATERYLAGVRRNLIQGSLLPRAQTAEVMAWLTGEQPGSCVLTGPAGGGKTACVVEVVEHLRTSGVQVLAFRLDRHMAATSATDLGKRLGLEESPALVLNAAATADGAEAVLIVDQLDAVSAMSGRASSAFDVVANLLSEAKETSIGVLVVCRAFDWHNDPRLRGLIREDDREVKLGALSQDEVRGVLTKAERDAAAFSARQLKLFVLPQNLSLFLNANGSSSTVFSSVNDLLERYWNEKRRLVGEKALGTGDQWMDVIGTMCDAMSRTQQLSVRKEKLDNIAPGYLDQCVSEDVLVVDGSRYAFSHESFFDYCFARCFVNKQTSLATMLKYSEQHLFRRAQVRQVLDYLREADPGRYAKELRKLAFGDGIRAHIQNLVFALLARHEPTDVEWEIWWKAVEPERGALDRNEKNDDRLSKYAWDQMFLAESWFKDFHRRGIIGGWLSGCSRYVELAVRYFRRHQRTWPDEVAGYLERLVGQGDQWRRRLRTVVFGPGVSGSRRYLDLVLRLVDEGTLDPESDGSPADLYHDLETRHPEWIPELLSRQLLRWCVLAAGQSDSTPVARQFDWLDGGAKKVVDAVAEGKPRTFVEHVLPAVIEVARAASRDGGEPPVVDAVWSVPIKGSSSGIDVCLHALERTLGMLAGDGEDLGKWITILVGERTHVANHLLLAVYRGGQHRYADEAAMQFCENPWRFRCGYSDHIYWCAIETLEAVAPHCGVSALAAIERTVLHYIDPFERTKEGRRSRGRAAYDLLSAFPQERLSGTAGRWHQEMQRRFGAPSAAPRGIVGGFVESPIPSEAEGKMNDNQWLRALATYSADHTLPYARQWPLQGGAHQLARILEAKTRDAPDRFARLSLRLPPDTNPVYFSALLRGLADTAIDEDAKVAVCRKAFKHAPVECGRDIADLLATAAAPLPKDALDMLHWLATQAKDRENEEQWKTDAGDGQFYFSGDSYDNGLNTTRGRAALAIGKLILEDDRYLSRFESTLNDLVRVRSAAVGSCVAFALRAVGRHDSGLALDLFLRMDCSEERLLGTRHVWEFMRENLTHQFTRLKALIVRMARSPHPEVSRSGARLVCMAAFFSDEAVELADEVRYGHRYQRLGSAEVAAANVGDPSYRHRCEDALATFFSDDDPEVRNVAASCFRHIAEQDLADFDPLVEAFCCSKALDYALPLLIALENARAPLPTMTLLACETLLGRTGSHSLDMGSVSKLAFRLYQQHPNDEWTPRALNLIDRLCLEVPAEAGWELDDFER